MKLEGAGAAPRFADYRRRLILGGALLVSLVVFGTAGYMAVERWSFVDALYMTVITATTVGFGEVHPLSQNGKLFTIVLIVFGVGTIGYALTNLVSFVVEGQLAAAVGGRFMRGRIERLQAHFIVCGFGRVGEGVARELSERQVPFLVVDDNPEAIGRATQLGYLVVEGDATVDATLGAAGIERARGLVAAASSDANNTYITLSAKALNRALFITARVVAPENEIKLRQAGADRVISPYLLAGRHMALAAIQPSAVNLLDTTMPARAGGAILAELEVTPESRLPGLTLGNACHDAGLTVLGLLRPNGTLLPNPSADTLLAAGDRLIVFGTDSAIGSIG